MATRNKGLAGVEDINIGHGAYTRGSQTLNKVNQTKIPDSAIQSFPDDRSATPSVANYTIWKTANTVATTISDFTNGAIGVVYKVTFPVVSGQSSPNTTLGFSSGTLKGNQGQDWVTRAKDVLFMSTDGTNWYCHVQHGAVDTVTTLADDSTSETPDVGGLKVVKTNNTTSRTITSFTGGVLGQRVLLIVNDANTKIQFNGSGNLKAHIPVDQDWEPSSGDWVNGVCDGTDWYCDIISPGALIA